MHEFLDNIRVLDLSRLLPGQYATSLLADMGAEIIMVEHPEYGNPSRHREPKINGRGGAQLIRDRDKRSIAIDLKDERGREAFFSLAATADVILDGFRPGTVDRLGIGYDDIVAVNEEIVYCSLTGYGQFGPYAERPGHDINYIGVSGLLSLTGDKDGPPLIPGYPIADLASALYASTAITAALAGRSGTGTYLDISMTDVVASFSMTYSDRLLGKTSSIGRGETVLNGAHPGYQVYKTADEKYLTIGALEDHFWENLCTATGHEELIEDNIDFSVDVDEAVQLALIETLKETIEKRPRDEWLKIFDEHDVPAGPVNDFEELFTDSHLRERGVFERPTEKTTDWSVEQLSFTHTFGEESTELKDPAPSCGRDTRPLLESVGYDSQTIKTLIEENIIKVSD